MKNKSNDMKNTNYESTISFNADYVDHAGRDDEKFPGANNVWYGIPEPLDAFLKSELMSCLTLYLEADKRYRITIGIKEI